MRRSKQNRKMLCHNIVTPSFSEHLKRSKQEILDAENFSSDLLWLPERFNYETQALRRTVRFSDVELSAETSRENDKNREWQF